MAWVKPGNIHLTLKFLGEMPASKLVPVSHVCSRLAHNRRLVPFEVSGVGCFPSRKNPRVLWVGLDKVPELLRQLHAELEQNLQQLGFPVEEKPFSPHLTIGRLRTPHKGEWLANSLTESDFAREKIEAKEIVLMKSELHSGGSIYTPLQRFPFQI